jgi:glucose 1-dehydrogenase
LVEEEVFNMKTLFISDIRQGAARSAAEYFAGLSWRVLVNAPKQSAPQGCQAVQLDLTDRQTLADYFCSLGDGFQGVIHPAPPPVRASLEQISPLDWERAMEEGPQAALAVTQAAGQALSRLGGGSIIYLGSIHAEKPTGFSPLFSMSCGAVQMLARESALHYGRAQVRSFYVQRGVMEEDMVGDGNTLSNMYSAPEKRIPAGTLPGPGELNDLLAFLFTGGAGLLNGSDLRADGGALMYYGEQVPPEDLKEALERVAAGDAHRRDALEHEPRYPIGAQAGRAALITGGGKGVGAGIARVLSRAGMKVCINYHSSRELAERTLRQVQEQGGEAFLYQADIGDPEQVQAMVEETVRRYGRLDVLVNNAALQLNRYVQEYDREGFARMWNTNIGGYLRALQACLPHLRQSPCARVVNVSSIHGKRPTVFDAGYAMTKGAIRMFTREAALELGRQGITVNCIDLGGCVIEGKTENHPFRLRWPEGTMKNPGRAIETEVYPEDVGHLVLYLCGESAGRITGDGIRLDGGSLLI